MTRSSRTATTSPDTTTDVVDDPGPPTPGDHVTLYTYTQASKYLKIHASTIRRMIHNGQISDRYITRIGGRARAGAKVFMSANQIVMLLRHWAEAETPTPPVPPIRKQKKPAVQNKAPVQRDYLPPAGLAEAAA